MLDIKKLLLKILNTDLVIAQGSSGGWTYRKWSSGTYECWKFSWGTSSATAAAWGSLYYTDVDGPAFPLTFTETPTVILTPYGAYAYILGCYGITTSKIEKIRFGSSGSGAGAKYANIYVKGKWK